VTSPAGVASIAPIGQAAIQAPHIRQSSVRSIISGSGEIDSGLWHHAHCKGHPLRKTVVRMPGPSCTEKAMILKIKPLIC